LTPPSPDAALDPLPPPDEPLEAAPAWLLPDDPP
jgi:hypothetical protein